MDNRGRYCPGGPGARVPESGPSLDRGYLRGFCRRALRRRRAEPLCRSRRHGPVHSPLRPQPGRLPRPHVQQHARHLQLPPGGVLRGRHGACSPALDPRGRGEHPGRCRRPEPRRTAGRSLLPERRRPAERAALRDNLVGRPGGLDCSPEQWPAGRARRSHACHYRPRPRRVARHCGPERKGLDSGSTRRRDHTHLLGF